MDSETARQDCEVDQIFLPGEIEVQRPGAPCDPAAPVTPPPFVTPEAPAVPRVLPPALPSAALVKSPRAVASCPGAFISETAGVSEFGNAVTSVLWENVGVVTESGITVAADVTLNAEAVRVFQDSELYRLSAPVTTVTGVDIAVNGSHVGKTYADLAQTLIDKYVLRVAVTRNPVSLVNTLAKLTKFTTAQCGYLVQLLVAAAGEYGDEPNIVMHTGDGVLLPQGSGSTSGLFALAVLVAEGVRTCSYNGLLKLVCTPDSVAGTPFSSVPIEPGDHVVAGSTQDEANEATLAWYALQPEMSACLYVNGAFTTSCPEGTLSGTVFALSDVIAGTQTDLITRVDIAAAVAGTNGFESTITLYVGETFTSEVIPAFTSITSVANANATALEYVISRLGCFCGSQGRRAYCNGTSQVSQSTSAPIPDADLDELIRRASGDAGLLSKYTVEPVDLVGDTYVLNQGSGVLATISTDFTDLRLFLEPAYELADVSVAQAAANAALDEWLKGWLTCLWYSPPKSCYCVGATDSRFTAEEIAALPVELDPALSSAMVEGSDGSYRLEAGQFEEATEPVSWDEILGDWCRASLVCWFCNTAIAPECGWAAGTDGVTPTNLALYIPPAVVDGEGIPANERGVSSDITIGLAAKAVCDNDPYLIAADAESRAKLPAHKVGESGDPACTYVNDEYTLTCERKAAIQSGDTNTAVWQSALYSTSVGRTVIIPAGMFSVAAADTTGLAAVVAYQAANTTARQYAMAVLRCEYTNPWLDIYCAAVAPSALPAEENYHAIVDPETEFTPFTIGDGVIAGDQVSLCSVGRHRKITEIGTEDPATGCKYDNPVEVLVGAYRSADSPMDALLQAYNSEVSKLDCFFTAADDVPCDNNKDNRSYMIYGPPNIHPVGNPHDTLPGYEVWLNSDYTVDQGGNGTLAGQQALYVVHDSETGAPLRRPRIPPVPGISGINGFVYGMDLFGNNYLADVGVYEVTTIAPRGHGSAKSYSSLADAQAQATAAAYANRKCLYTNWFREYSCPRGSAADSFISYAQPAGVVAANSTEDANVQVEQTIKGAVTCKKCNGFQLLASEDLDGHISVGMCGGGTIRMAGGNGGGLRGCASKNYGGDNEDKEYTVLYDGTTDPAEECPMTKLTFNTGHADLSKLSYITTDNHCVDFWIQTKCCAIGLEKNKLKHILRASVSHGVAVGDTQPGESAYEPLAPAGHDVHIDKDKDRPRMLYRHLGTVCRTKASPMKATVAQTTVGTLEMTLESRPFPFAVRRGIEGAAEIYFGQLIAVTTSSRFQTLFVNGVKLNKLVEQPIIQQEVVLLPDMFNVVGGRDKYVPIVREDHKTWGDIWLVWKVRVTDGSVIEDSVGVFMIDPAVNATTTLELVDIQILNSDLVRLQPNNQAKYGVKLASVPESLDAEIVQNIGSDVPWAIHLIVGDPASESSGSGGSSGSGSSTTSWSGSDKSTAIVPVWWENNGEYMALFVNEMPEVRFDDVMVVRTSGRKTEVEIDPKLIHACTPGSLVVCGATSEAGARLGVKVTENKLHIRSHGLWVGDDTVVVRFSGVRRGHHDKRFPSRTREQFIKNEKFINSAY